MSLTFPYRGYAVYDVNSQYPHKEQPMGKGLDGFLDMIEHGLDTVDRVTKGDPQEASQEVAKEMEEWTDQEVERILNVFSERDGGRAGVGGEIPPTIKLLGPLIKESMTRAFQKGVEAGSNLKVTK